MLMVTTVMVVTLTQCFIIVTVYVLSQILMSVTQPLIPAIISVSTPMDRISVPVTMVTHLVMTH